MNLKYYLLIFQLEAYRTARFLNWVARHYLRFEEQKTKEPVWTTKAKLLYCFAIALFWLTVIYLYFACSFFVFAILTVVLWLNIFIFLPLALLLLLPYEIINRIRVKYLIEKKVEDLKKSTGLKVIGITGSYGKTSTKLILHELLPKSLITPKSFNTLFGIWKVVDYELNKRYRYFVCEMGAYKRGDVKEFCELVHPNIAVLTGINEQHLERFGSIENTIQAKFEVLTGTVDGGIGIVNLDNQLVRENLKNFDNTVKRAPIRIIISGKQRDYSLPPEQAQEELQMLLRESHEKPNKPRIKLIGYTTENQQSEQCQEILAATNWRVENNQTVCEITHEEQTYNLTTPLIGRGHLSNILAGIAVSISCGEDINKILERASKLKQIPHRLELRAMPGLTILDDTYSSNPTGFREALDALGRFDGKKVLVTPGIVELGEKAIDIHEEIGSLAAKFCDEIVLVGNSKNIEAMQDSILSTGYTKDKITRLPNRTAAQELLRDRANSNQVILMENDLPDQYL